MSDADQPAVEADGAPFGPAYSEATLDEDARALLASAPLLTFNVPDRQPTEVVGEDGVVGEPGYAATKARACVIATQGEARTQAEPLAVDIGTYEGVDAVVILLPEGAGSPAASITAIDVWVVGADCLDDGGADTAVGAVEVLAHRLLSTVEATMSGRRAEAALRQVLASVPMPESRRGS